eukprot:g3534.t1
MWNTLSDAVKFASQGDPSDEELATKAWKYSASGENTAAATADHKNAHRKNDDESSRSSDDSSSDSSDDDDDDDDDSDDDKDKSGVASVTEKLASSPNAPKISFSLSGSSTSGSSILAARRMQAFRDLK